MSPQIYYPDEKLTATTNVYQTPKNEKETKLANTHHCNKHRSRTTECIYVCVYVRTER